MIDFLNGEERIKLCDILANSNQLSTANDRIEFLDFCGLKKYCHLVQIDKRSRKFSIDIYNKLSKDYLDNSQKLALVVFLEYLIELDSQLSQEDKDFINLIINKPDWASLLQDSYLTPLHELISKLQLFSTTLKFSPEKSQQIINIFRQISSYLRDGYSLMKALEKYKDNFKEIDSSIEVLITKFCKESEVIKNEKGHEIPIVLFVMNKTEAEELDSKKAFCDYHNELCDNFQRLKQTLTRDGINNWVNHYQDSPQQWQPFHQINTQNNIKQLIEEVFIKIKSPPKIVPEFIDIHRLNQDNSSSFELLRKLRNEGCIVIMDAISMQHPEIQGLFRRTALDAFPNTLVVMITPIHSLLDIVDKIESVIEQRIDIDFYHRLEFDDSDENKCIKVGEKTGFSNWLTEKVKYLLPKIEEENSSGSVKGYWYKEYGGS